jgi:hypothetical protein
MRVTVTRGAGYIGSCPPHRVRCHWSKRGGRQARAHSIVENNITRMDLHQAWLPG